jgi:hypothetical protein
MYELFSYLELFLFGCAIFLLLFMLIAGEKHSKVRSSTKKHDSQSDGIISTDRINSLLYNFPASWNSDNIDISGDTQISVNSKIVMDSNGFPKHYESSESTVSPNGSPRAIENDDTSFIFEPSQSKQNTDYYIATAIKRAFVNAPHNVSNILQAPAKMIPNMLHPSNVLNMFPGRDSGKTGNAANRFPSSASNASTEALTDEFDESVFVNIGAHNLGTTVARIIDSSEILKKGKMHTLGARKLNEKSPKVKERELIMTGYYLYYYDSYNMKREFPLRNCTMRKLSARATSGDVAGQNFHALVLDQGSEQLTIGSQDENERDDWLSALCNVVESIRREEIENDGEEEEFRHKGLPSFAEQSFLNPQLPNAVRDKLETISNVRRRLTFNAHSDDIASMGNRRSSLKAKVNSDHIISPLHGE